MDMKVTDHLRHRIMVYSGLEKSEETNWEVAVSGVGITGVKATGTVGRDIIVATMTDPSMVMELKKSKGVITDEGGRTCHAAIIARQFNIACVVGCGNATQILKDGDMVMIEGNLVMRIERYGFKEGNS